MAKIEENAKRRSNEVEEQSATPRPPPKKRFLSRASSPDEDSDDNDESSDPFKEPLEAFRKDAIARQWKDYTRSLSRWKKIVEQADSRLVEKNKILELWQDSFKKLQTFLSNLIQEGMSTFDQTSNAMDIDSSIFMDEDWAATYTPTVFEAYKTDQHNLTIPKLNQLIESWITKREKITTGFQSVFEQGSLKEIRHEHEQVLSAWLKDQKTLQELKSRYNATNFKYLMLSEELRILTDRLESTEQNTRQTQLELEKIEIQKESKLNETKSFDLPSVTSKTSIASSSSAPAAAAAESSSSSFHAGNAQDPLAHIQQLLDQRLRDIDLIKEDRIGLKQQIACLEMDLICVPESRIYRAPICRQLSQSRAYHKDKCNRLADMCHDISTTLDDLSNTRRRLIRELDGEQVSHFKGLEEQLRKLDIDLTRIRGQRDALQMNLEERKAATESGRASIGELKVIAETRRERVTYLESEVLRLQRKMAARTGNKEFYELLMNSDGQEDLFKPLVDQLKELEAQVEETKARIYQDVPKETVDHELAQISEMKQIELDLTEFEQKYGFQPSPDMDIAKVLQDRIEKEKSIIAESKEKIIKLEATEKQLLSEIESVAKAYNDLEQENIAKVKELAEAEDEIIKLQTERVKYSQTFTALNKSKDAHTMVANALSKQSDKQLAHIKQLNEREKNLNNQLICLDRELNASNAVYDIYKQKREEAKLTLDELKDRTSFSKNKISELQKMILEKIRLVEEGTYTRSRLEESNEILKRKVESTNKGERPAEAKLRKEREEYRSLLNCSQCRVRLKSHIILKCMHTFCKECLENKKRCPSCDETFSVHDVKQFYF